MRERTPRRPDTNPPIRHRRLFFWSADGTGLERFQRTLTRLYGDTRFTVAPDHSRPGGHEVIPGGDDLAAPWLRAFFDARRRVIKRKQPPTDKRIAMQMQDDDPDARGASEREIERQRVLHHLPTSRD